MTAGQPLVYEVGAEMIERSRPLLFDDLRRFDFKIEIVQVLCDFLDITDFTADCLDTDVSGSS